MTILSPPNEAVDPEDTAFRRVQPVLLVTDPKVPGGARASSSAFNDDADGSSMSTYLASVVTAIGLSVEAVVAGKPSRWAVAAIPVQVLIEEEQTIVRDPIIEAPAPHPCDPAHALVHGQKVPKSRRERIARRSPLVYTVP